MLNIRPYRTALATALMMALSAAHVSARAEGLFDFLFGSESPLFSPARPRDSYRSRAPYPGAPGGEKEAGRLGPPAEATLAVDGFCVRTCDGYYFPLIKSANTTRQHSCEYACPSAPMEIYDGSSIEQARNSRGGRYSGLPTAFSFRDKTTEQCACNEPQSSQAFFQRISRSDPTLRSGDVLVERNGASVYRGSDFVPLERASFMPPQARQRVRDILRRGADHQSRIAAPRDGDAAAPPPSAEATRVERPAAEAVSEPPPVGDPPK